MSPGRRHFWHQEWLRHHQTNLPWPTCLCGGKMILIGHLETTLDERGFTRWFREFRCCSHWSHWCEQEPRKYQIRWYNDPPEWKRDENGRMYQTVQTPYPVPVELGAWISIPQPERTAP